MFPMINQEVIYILIVALELLFVSVLSNNASNMVRFSFSQSNIFSTIFNSFTQNHDSFILHIDVNLNCNCNGFSQVLKFRWLVFGGSDGRIILLAIEKTQSSSLLIASSLVLYLVLVDSKKITVVEIVPHSSYAYRKNCF
jgi:hypothetical protein